MTSNSRGRNSPPLSCCFNIMPAKPRRQGNPKDQRMRQQLALEAARIMAEEGVNDYYVAKQKAAARLHAPHTQNMPRNDEVQAALMEYQRLFKSATQPQQLQQLRLASLRAMSFLQRFEPRLVGAVLDGSATAYSNITLHLFADPPDGVGLFLMDEGVPYNLGSQRVTMVNGEVVEALVYTINDKEDAIELVVFDHKALRNPPRCPVTGKALQRATLQSVEMLTHNADSQPDA